MSDGDKLRFPCPSCGRRLAAPAAAAGKRFTCPACSHVVNVPQPAAEHVLAAASHAVAAQAAGGMSEDDWDALLADRPAAPTVPSDDSAEETSSPPELTNGELRAAERAQISQPDQTKRVPRCPLCSGTMLLEQQHPSWRWAIKWVLWTALGLIFAAILWPMLLVPFSVPVDDAERTAYFRSGFLGLGIWWIVFPIPWAVYGVMSFLADERPRRICEHCHYMVQCQVPRPN